MTSPAIEVFLEDWANQCGVQNHPLCIAAEIIKPTYGNYQTAAALISGKNWVDEADKEFLMEMTEHVKGLYETLKDTPRHGEDGSDLWANYIDDTWVPWYKASVRDF